MTALKKYAKLEATGLWRPLPDAQRREVAVAFGEASLVLSDLRNGEALGHWSLPAVERRNPGTLPAVYAPGREAAAETLEIEDTVMIDAIETVRAALARRRPRRGRLRLLTLAATLAAMGLLGVFWLPRALVGHTVQVMPFVKRQEIGLALLDAMARYTGAPCTAEMGQAALSELVSLLFSADGTRVVVLRDGLPPGTVLALPGRVLIVERRLLENHDGPEILAGHLLAERLRADLDDPLLRVLERAGLRASFTMLATGTLPEGTLDDQAQAWLRNFPAAPLPSEPLLARFAEAHLTSTPYALALDPTGQQTLALIEGDPIPPGLARPMMPDADWLSLQAICDR